MSVRRQVIGVLGLLAGIVVGLHIVGRLGEMAPTPVPNRSGPRFAEVRDAYGQLIQRGAFRLVEDEADEIEWEAHLEPTGIVPLARGRVEVEFDKPIGSGEQEIAFSVRNLPSGAAFFLSIDGREVATGIADGDGRLEVERTVRAEQDALMTATPSAARPAVASRGR